MKLASMTLLALGTELVRGMESCPTPSLAERMKGLLKEVALAEQQEQTSSEG